MTKPMSPGQRAYEQKRATRAGVSLEKWLSMKERDREAEERARVEAATKAAEPAKKPSLLSRLIERAHKPI